MVNNDHPQRGEQPQGWSCVRVTQVDSALSAWGEWHIAEAIPGELVSIAGAGRVLRAAQHPALPTKALSQFPPSAPERS